MIAGDAFSKDAIRTLLTEVENNRCDSALFVTCSRLRDLSDAFETRSKLFHQACELCHVTCP